MRWLRHQMAEQQSLFVTRNCFSIHSCECVCVLARSSNEERTTDEKSEGGDERQETRSQQAIIVGSYQQQQRQHRWHHSDNYNLPLNWQQWIVFHINYRSIVFHLVHLIVPLLPSLDVHFSARRPSFSFEFDSDVDGKLLIHISLWLCRCWPCLWCVFTLNLVETIDCRHHHCRRCHSWILDLYANLNAKWMLAHLNIINFLFSVSLSHSLSLS